MSRRWIPDRLLAARMGGRRGASWYLIRPILPTLLLILLVSSGTACRDLTGEAALPAGTQSPDAYNTTAGALGMYRGAKGDFQQALFGSILSGGALSDELTASRLGSSNLSVGAAGDPIDERILSEGETGTVVTSSDGAYISLQRVRGSTLQAMGLLASYAPGTAALQGEMYTLRGYAEVLLADLFCSGVPLSTLDFQGDFTYHTGSTTDEVYAHAAALFDSALVLSGDSASVLNLARVGKGRALLARGEYAAAAQAVAAVPTAFTYSLPRVWGAGQDYPFVMDPYSQQGSRWNVSTAEGGTGLPFGLGTDPRVPVRSVGTNAFGVPQALPVLYQPETPAALVLASGVEARLVEAEAALQAGDPSWLTVLNALRTNGTQSFALIEDTLGVTGCQSAAICGFDPGDGLGGSTPDFGQPYPGGFQVPAGFSVSGADTVYPAHTIIIHPTPGASVDVQTYCFNNSWYIPCYQGDTMVVLHYTNPALTHWEAGTGGVRDLAPLTNPGAGLSGQAALDAQINLLFYERAYWLFLTGHRQGDLRRLVRQTSQGGYGRPQKNVYPSGAYYGGLGAYGSDVTVPIPASERVNPLFHGCIDRSA